MIPFLNGAPASLSGMLYNTTTRDVAQTNLNYYANKLIDATNVKYWGAKGDGINDDTSAIQVAIDSAAVSSNTVYIPSGNYRASGLNLKMGVSLRGSGIESCRILVTNTSVPAITVQAYTELSDLEFFYPNQPMSGAVPVTYPATIWGGIPAPDHTYISKIRFNGSYTGLQFTNSQQVTISDCDGFPLNAGMFFDRAGDVLRLNNIHLNPNVNRAIGSALASWVFTHGIAFAFGSCDAPQLNGILTFGYKEGIRLAPGAITGSANMVTINNSIFDVCSYPIYVDNSMYGVFFNNCIFTSSVGGYYFNVGNWCWLGGSADAWSQISFNNCSFRNFYTDAVKINTHASFNNCQFLDYAKISGGYYSGISIVNGDSVVKVANCTFNGGSYAGVPYGLSRGISTLTNSTILVSGSEFLTMGDHAIYASGGARLSVVSSKLPSFRWNGVIGTCINGVLATDANPTNFAGCGPFIWGDHFSQMYPTNGAPTGWDCIQSGTPGLWITNSVYP